MIKFENKEALTEYVDLWFDALMRNTFHYKGDLNKEKDIKKFLKIKKISITAERDVKEQDKFTYIILHKYKEKYRIVVDEEQMTFEETKL